MSTGPLPSPGEGAEPRLPLDRQRSARPLHDRGRGPRGAVASPAAAEGAASLAVFSAYALWFLMTWEVDQFLTSMVGLPFYRTPLLVVPLLGLALLTSGDRKALYGPLVVFVLLHLGAAVFAQNTGLARDAFKYMVYVLVLFGSTVCFLTTPARMMVVLKLYLLHFVWFGPQGLPSGTVTWHPLLGNEDSYGPLMVMGMGFSYFYGMATSSRLWRWIARAAFFVSLLGIVVSFARGAAIAAGATLLYSLARSPRRGRAIVTLMLMALILLPVAGLFIDIDKYIAEIQSSSEGDDGRIAVWTLAWNVFKTSPIFGVGAFNFGPTAAEITEADPTRAKGADPAQLWNAWVHNAPMQILAEEGVIGIVVWLVMLVGFFRRNHRLRRSEAKTRWGQQGGETLDLGMLSLALNAAMIAWLGCSIFYNQIYLHWFWSLITISYALHSIVNLAPAGTGVKPLPR